MTRSSHGRALAGVTLDDVAGAAGVSLATASRVLNGSTRKVAEPYRHRVEAAARELGYTANIAAQATARGSSGIIALLVGDIADPYFSQVAAGVARGADEEGLILTISITGRDSQREERIVHALRGQRPRGVILAASRTDNESDDVLREFSGLATEGGRIVALGPGVHNARVIPIDNFGGARSLGVALGDLGYRRAIILAAACGVYTSDERVSGFTQGFTAQGGAIDMLMRDDFSKESGAGLMRAALDKGVVTGTVVFAISDAVALGALAALRQSPREPGRDIAVAGFDDIPSSQDVTPSLTTVRVPLTEIGYEAFRAAAYAEWAPQSGVMPLEVIIRESSPPRAGCRHTGCI